MYTRSMGTGLALLLPALVMLALLVVYPVLNAVYLSFHSQLAYEMTGRYVGLANYLSLLSSRDFWHALWINVIWASATVLGQLVLGVVAALLLHEVTRAKGLLRGAVLLPFFTPTVAVTLAWKWLLNPNYGLINSVLRSVGLIQGSIDWFASPGLALGVIIVVAVWRYFPFVTVNVLAALQTIPTELYEAARIDGASRWSEFRYITVPQIAGVLSAVTLLRVIFMFKKVDEILLLTGGGPGNSTETLSVFAYRYAFQAMQLGKGTAAAMLAFAVLLSVILVHSRLEFSRTNQGGG